MNGYTIYIAGPMRGLPDFNFPAFDMAETLFRLAGFEVMNPASMDRDDPIKATNDAEATAMARKYAHRDTQAIIHHCTHIALLPGWENSKGARAEKALAEWCNLTVLDGETGETLIQGELSRTTTGSHLVKA